MERVVSIFKNNYPEEINIVFDRKYSVGVEITRREGITTHYFQDSCYVGTERRSRGLTCDSSHSLELRSVPVIENEELDLINCQIERNNTEWVECIEKSGLREGSNLKSLLRGEYRSAL